MGECIKTGRRQSHRVSTCRWGPIENENDTAPNNLIENDLLNRNHHQQSFYTPIDDKFRMHTQAKFIKKFASGFLVF